jgi:hypothetical protein
MKLASHPRTGRGIAELTGAGVVVVAVVLVAVLAPSRDRPLTFALLLGVVAAAGVVVGVLVGVRRERARHDASETDREIVEAAFNAQSLEGFPEQELAALLPGLDQSRLLVLQTAWVLATYGHSAVWLQEHFHVNGEVAHLLAEAADRRRTDARPMR